MKKIKIISIFALCILCTLTAAACDSNPIPQKKQQTTTQELVETEEIPLPDPRPEQGEIKSDENNSDENDSHHDNRHGKPRVLPRIPTEKPEKRIPVRPMPKPAPPKN